MRTPPRPTRATAAAAAALTSPSKRTFAIERRFTTNVEQPPSEFFTPGVDQVRASCSMTSNGFMSTKEETFEISRGDRSRVRLAVVQSSNETKAVVTALLFPFVPLTDDELRASSQRFGPAIVAFCTQRIGTRVGNGECWTLADEAIKACGADPVLGLNFGQEIDPSDVAPGDILQFKSCRFDLPWGGFKTAGAPDHTAIVVGRGPEGIRVLEQNPGPVGEGSYDLSQLVSGTMKAWRVVPKR